MYRRWRRHHTLDDFLVRELLEANTRLASRGTKSKKLFDLVRRTLSSVGGRHDDFDVDGCQVDCEATKVCLGICCVDRVTKDGLENRELLSVMRNDFCS